MYPEWIMITLAEDAIADCWMKISAQCTLVITKARRMLTSYTEGGETIISVPLYTYKWCAIPWTPRGVFFFYSDRILKDKKKFISFRYGKVSTWRVSNLLELFSLEKSERKNLSSQNHSHLKNITSPNDKNSPFTILRCDFCSGLGS